MLRIDSDMEVGLMQLINKFIIIFMLFGVLLLFLGMTQTLPYWVTDFQKTLLNNVVLFIDMALIIWVAVQ
jgi:hypothetical protein